MQTNSLLRAYLVASVPLNILQQVDVGKIDVSIIFWHPRVVYSPPPRNALELCLDLGVHLSFYCGLLFQS